MNVDLVIAILKGVKINMEDIDNYEQTPNLLRDKRKYKDEKKLLITNLHLIDLNVI